MLAARGGHCARAALSRTTRAAPAHGTLGTRRSARSGAAPGGSGRSRIRAAVRAREGTQAEGGAESEGRRPRIPPWARDTRASVSRRTTEGRSDSRAPPRARGCGGSVVVRRLRGAVDTVATESEGEEGESQPVAADSSRRARQRRGFDHTQRSLDAQLRAVVRAGRFRRRRYPGPDPVPLGRAGGRDPQRTSPRRRLRTRSHSPPPTAAPPGAEGQAGGDATDRNGFKFECVGPP